MRKRILLVLIALLLCFIWGNSLMSGEVSGAISSGLLGWIIRTFPFMNWLPEYLLRKLGHFSEFGLLGFLLCWYFLQPEKARIAMPLFLSMLAANIDETIQVVVPNRGPSVVDVWIDTAGACTGMAVLLLGYTVINYLQKGKTK